MFISLTRETDREIMTETSAVHVTYMSDTQREAERSVLFTLLTSE